LKKKNEREGEVELINKTVLDESLQNGHYTIVLQNIRENVPESETYIPIIEALFTCLKLRDVATAEHSILMAYYTIQLARIHDIDNADMYFIGSLTHDIGKLAMSDSILKGNKRLTTEERKSLSQHAIDGEELLKKLNMPQLIIEIASIHHERYDGSGYPLGLIGKEIPLSGRITAITDTFATLIGGRPYQKSKNKEEAMSVMKENEHLFDSVILNSFNELINSKQLSCLLP